MSNPENTKFMDLTLEEQLDLVSYVLQGNTLSSRRSECENFLEVVNDKPTVLTFRWDHMFKKNPSRLENLIKQKENLEKEIADLMAKESSETAPVSNYNTSPIQSPSEKEKSSDNGCEEAQRSLTRITLDNWKELLEVGDEVVVIDDKGEKSFHTIADLDIADDMCFMEVDMHWVHFGEDNTCEDGSEYYVEG